MDSQTGNLKTTISVKATNKLRVNPEAAQISIGEFLNFLKTAYQVQESVEGILLSGGMTEAVNWLKCKENQLSLKTTSSYCQTSDTLINSSNYEHGDDKSVHRKLSTSNFSESDILKKKLGEVLSEGLLDSVLPYLTLNGGNSSRKTKVYDKPIHNTQSLHASNDRLVGRRRSTDVSIKPYKADSEVEIHVCDELKNMKKTFVCNQQLLVEKMGYFAEVTQGQRLEDMDISVHCDIGIFEWLMLWVKKESLLAEDWPELDPQCVIPILVSAAFLQMEPLQSDCLFFCHEHMNDILRTNTNLSCLNDSVLTRLAAMYTNVEVEGIKDRKDKIQSRLFAKLIQSLCEPESESLRGHWSSMAIVFKCIKCQQFIIPAVASKIPCLPSRMRLQPDGTIISLHIKDSSWNINEYIMKLHKTLKTWRKVYWRLWGDAHFLFCVACKRYFPANQIGWCRYHPDAPQFFTLDAQKAPLPIGRFPCCGERAYRFQLLESNSGCQFRQHVVCTQNVSDSTVFSMLETLRNIIEEDPPQLLFPERLTRLVARDASNDKKFVCKESFWWDGIEIIPPRPKLGLLSAFANRILIARVSQDSSDECTEEESACSSGDSEDGSTESHPTTKNKVAIRNRSKRNGAKLWQQNLSARSNQDNQRAYEENAVREMTAYLNRNTINETMRNCRGMNRNNIPLGGVWVRLESEWKDSFNPNSSQQKPKNIFMQKLCRSRGK